MSIEQRFRVGKETGRTIYRMVGASPSDDDQMVGVLDSPELAQQFVDSANECQDLRERLQSIIEGRPFSDCAGDCGRDLYCCGGEWDLKNKLQQAEEEKQRLAATDRQVETVAAIAEKLVERHGINPQLSEILAGCAQMVAEGERQAEAADPVPINS